MSRQLGNAGIRPMAEGFLWGWLVGVVGGVAGTVLWMGGA